VDKSSCGGLLKVAYMEWLVGQAYSGLKLAIKHNDPTAPIVRSQDTTVMTKCKMIVTGWKETD
jgi:hypothetical protein